MLEKNQELVLWITDPGVDPDDVVATMVLVGMQRLGKIQLVGAIANLDPAEQRAYLLKGILNTLGETNIPVGIGTDCNTTHAVKSYEFDFNLAQKNEVDTNGYVLMQNILRNAEQKSITLLLLSGMTDAHKLVINNSKLVQEKTKQVIIMGGATFAANGNLLLDMTASNNKFDPNPKVAQELHSSLINLKIPLKIITRYAAYAAAVTPHFYDEIAIKGGLVGIYLKQIQKSAIDGLWQYVCDQPVTAYMNRFWFSERFCHASEIPCKSDESPWQYVNSLHLYDALAALWISYPEYFNPVQSNINGVTHCIAGISDTEYGLTNCRELIQVIADLLLLSVQSY